MRRTQTRTIIACGILCCGLLAGCSGGSSTAATPTPTPEQALTPTATGPVNTSTQPPPSSATATPVPQSSATDAPATATTPADEASYTDDRSNAAALMDSYYSAINRREYLRAYSYWEPGAASPAHPDFEAFAAGYAATAAVDLTLGSIRSDAGAGQRNYWVPVLLDATLTDGTHQFFVGCYRQHLTQPEMQSEPPYQPLAITGAHAQEVVDFSTGEVELLNACAEDGGLPGRPAQTAVSASDDIGPQNYLDDRSTPETLLRSYYNAINSAQYARAYGYWEPNATQLAPFDAFASGYAETVVVDLTLGTANAGAAAGNLYWDLPARIDAQMQDGSTQTFVGCYRLHLSRPAIQATPPFQPLAIQSADVQRVAAGADAASLLVDACAP